MKAKKTILLIILAVSLVACNEIPQDISEVLDLDEEIVSYFVDTWQEVYTELLINFADSAPIKEMEFLWHFALHDITKSGTPALLLANKDYSGHMTYHYIYTFDEGHIIQLEFNSTFGVAWVPDNNNHWIVFTSAVGSGNLYSKFIIDNIAVVFDMLGVYVLSQEGHDKYYEGYDISDCPEYHVFSLNGDIVTLAEFESVFGNWSGKRDRVWIRTFELNEANINKIINNYYSSILYD